MYRETSLEKEYVSGPISHNMWVELFCFKKISLDKLNNNNTNNKNTVTKWAAQEVRQWEENTNN